MTDRTPGARSLKPSLVFLAASAFVLVVAAREQRPTAPPPREDAYRQNNIGVARLEQYDYPGAVTAFRRALEIDRALAIAQLNLGIALLYAAQIEAAATEARSAVQKLPATPNAHYVLGLVARAENRADEAIAAFRRVMAIDPSDVGSRVQLAQILLGERRQYQDAVALFEEALRIEPFNATAAYGLATALTRAGQREKGAEAMKRFQQLRDNPAAITYSSTYLEQGRYGEAIVSTGLEAELVDPSVPQVAFAEATAALLSSATDARGMTLFDADADGDLDLALAGPKVVRLLRNERGRLAAQTGTDVVASNAGMSAAVAGDYDNDGAPDLFLISAAGGQLLRQQPNGRFRDVTGETTFPPLRASAAAAFADIDHDGDLDIVTGAPQVVRNNGKGSFTDITASTKLADTPGSVAVVPTDYDSRRDLDLLFVSADGPPALYSNARDGTFRDVAASVGLSGAARYQAVAAGDVNKDGATDFFFARSGAPGRFAMSTGTGRFTSTDAAPQTADATAAQFIDYDNDGLLDLFVLTPAGPRLWRNVGAQWADVTSRALPAGLLVAGDPPSAFATGDLDGDGDTDAIVRLTSGGIRAWRNDGGNRRASLRVRLAARVSSRTASGAKVDVRAGSLRQRIETSSATPPSGPADLVFGLGARTGADVVRVLWPAGILQAETNLPAAPRGSTSSVVTITELDRKPSSCPFLFTWNGSRFEFVTDFLGGGEMGYWVAPGVRNVPDSDEYVRIRGDQLQPREGRYELRVTNELEEVVFVDRLQLLVVAHPSDTDVYPNEGMRSPSEQRPFALTTVRGPRPPRRAVDHHGHDVLDRVAARDRRFVDDFRLEPIQGYAEEHALTIELGLRPEESHARLLLTGWTDYAFSSDNVAAHQAGLSFRPPWLEVKDASGRWVTAIPEIGLPVGRPQTVVVDLSPHVARGAREVRIVATLRVYWDEILVDTSEPAPQTVTRLEPADARLGWRGFSAEWSPDGRAPFGYDYGRVSASSPWKLMPGRYTREGHVTPLVSAIDDRFVIMAPGDEIALSFDATRLPPLPAGPPPRRRRFGEARRSSLESQASGGGWTRTFLLFADGFSKEMNLHSASPDRVEPLPFHAMSGYPYPESERYPDSPDHEEYRAKYNTRVIGRPLPPLEAASAQQR